MELRMKLYYRRIHSGGARTLVCPKCETPHQLMLFDGQVCAKCWEGYDIEASKLLYIEEIRQQAASLLKKGIPRKEMAKAIGYSPCRLGQFINRNCHTMEIADALENWMNKEAAHA